MDSENIEDYYLDPWDLGYHRLIHWDHGFKGREALLTMKNGPHRRKVWLQWNPDDVLKIQESMLRDGPTYKYLEMPAAHYATCPYRQGCAERQTHRRVDLRSVYHGSWRLVLNRDHQ